MTSQLISCFKAGDIFYQTLIIITVDSRSKCNLISEHLKSFQVNLSLSKPFAHHNKSEIGFVGLFVLPCWDTRSCRRVNKAVILHAL